MELVYINPLITSAVYLGIAVLAAIITYFALIAGREKLEEDEAKDIVRYVERRTLS